MRSAKFGRQRDQRLALIKSLAEALVLNESIETTSSKAKAVARYTERLITKAKKGKSSLHNRRQVISGLQTTDAAHKLVDEIAPKLLARQSGYFRIERSSLRAGDGARLAKVSFVDDLKAQKQAPKTTETKADKKTDQKAESEPTKGLPPTVSKDTSSKIPRPQKPSQAPKRFGIRGNR